MQNDLVSTKGRRLIRAKCNLEEMVYVGEYIYFELHFKSFFSH